jgi:hypothetical protein
VNDLSVGQDSDAEGYMIAVADLVTRLTIFRHEVIFVLQSMTALPILVPLLALDA